MELRKDIAEAVGRMRVTFGTRTAIRDLVTSLEEGETVVDMVACLFAGGDGLLVLTDRRVIALRDDFSAFRMKAVQLGEIKAVDYAPRIHDGLGVLTVDGRIAVRRMNRQDSDRVVDGILVRVPGAVLGVSRPSTPGAKPTFRAQNGAAVVAAAEVMHPPGAPASEEATPPVELGDAQVRTAISGPSDTELEAGAEADHAVLRGVLGDLHAKGLLTDEELAAKIAQLISQA